MHLPTYRTSYPGKPGFVVLVPVLLALVVCMILPLTAQAQEERATRGFLRFPDIFENTLVFTSAGDLWTAPATGGTAIRLTTHEGEERFAKFSADGQWIAFTGDYYGNEDVFIMPSTGGEPVQLTYEGYGEQVVGWDKDGYIVYRRRSGLPNRSWELYRVSPEGGFPEKLPYVYASNVTYEPDGPRTAIVVNFMGFHPWKRYQGGEAEKIWVGNPDTPEFEMVSHWLGNESYPMWADNDRIYHLSDSLGRANIWSMRPNGSELQRETELDEFDIRWPSLRGEQIVFQYGVDLKVYNIRTGSLASPQITVPTDLHSTRLRFIDPSDYVTDWSVNEDGKRLVVSARGEIFTLPVMADGLIRQWTYTSSSCEKLAQFMPGGDGAILTVSDQSGEERIMTLDRPGGELEMLESEPVNGWEWRLLPSPDGNRIAHSDHTQNLYILTKSEDRRGNITWTETVVDSGEFEYRDYAWSPDSRYLAYTRTGEPSTYTIYIYDTQYERSFLASDPHFSTYSPAWDPDGRFLYCITDRNFNGYQDYDRGLFMYDNVSTLALIRLQDDIPSPFIARGDAPEASGIPEATWLPSEESGEGEEESEETPPVVIHTESLLDHMVPIPEGPGNYGSLTAISNKIYYLARESGGILNGSDRPGYEGTRLMMYDIAARESHTVATGVGSYRISGDGSVLVVYSGGSWYHGDAGATSLSMNGDNRVNTGGWEMEVSPREEWREMLRSAWRTERDFFYEEGMHGVDWEAIWNKYDPLVDRLVTRDDLRDLIREVLSELHAGHAYVWGGDMPDPESAPIGYLGVDMEPDPRSGYYIIRHILNPEPGTDGGSSPLVLSDPYSGPGMYIFAVDGRPVHANENIHRLFQNKAGQEVALLLNDSPNPETAREVIVRTLRSESRLRYLDYLDRTRRYVQEHSDGQIGYVYLPDMSGPGLRDWGRDYYPQRRMPGLIIDDRWNGGGNVSEYFIQILSSRIFAIQSSRRGVRETKPHGAPVGHIAVLCNAGTASDGETFAEATKRVGFGTLIGERTWGGWVWIWPRYPLMDNGGISVPEFGGWDLDGEWMIEGPGVYPEVEVVNDPASLMQGIDPQLNAAMEHLLQQIEDDPRELPERPDGPEKL